MIEQKVQRALGLPAGSRFGGKSTRPRGAALTWVVAVGWIVSSIFVAGCEARGRETVASRPPDPSSKIVPWPPPPPLDRSSMGRDVDGEARLRADLEILASPRFGGRGTGDEGARLTTDFIAARFRELGLVARGDTADDKGVPLPERSYLYRFTARPNAKADPPKLTFTSDAAPLPALPDSAIQSVDGASSGEAQGALVAAGFGVSTKEWDDYAGGSVSGKIVVVRRGAPPIPKKTPEELYELAKFRRKIRTAKAHGAIGLIVVSASEEIPPPPIDPKGAGLPAVVMSRSLAERTFVGSRLDEVAGWQPSAPSTPTPIPHLTATLATHIEPKGDWANDVAAFLPAIENSEAGDEWVVLGAHHDHLGMGGAGSRAPGVHAIHPGADDNGSGTVLVLEVARALARLPQRPRRNILFLAFGAEELGLVGSRAWCDDPTVPMEKIVAMVNTDMVGRLRDEKLTIEGTASEDAWPPFFEGAQEGLPLVLDRVKNDQFGGRSDHASFRDQGVPVAFLFTGLHPDYHRPSDTADKINYVGLEEIATFTARVVLGISEHGFVRKPAPPPKP